MWQDATHKWPGKTSREWREPLTMGGDVTTRVEQVWRTLGLQAKLASSPYAESADSYLIYK